MISPAIGSLISFIFTNLPSLVAAVVSVGQGIEALFKVAKAVATTPEQQAALQAIVDQHLADSVKRAVEVELP